MNKQKFVDYLRSPERLTEGQFDELQKLLTDYPYFSIAKSIAARGAKDLEHDNKSQFISSAAIYATDRKHLKKYINGELVFLVDAPKISDEVVEEITSNVAEANTVSDKSPDAASEEVRRSVLDEIGTHVPTGNEVDQVLDELERDIKQLEKSRLHFLEVQDHIDDAKFTNKVVSEIEEPTPTEEVNVVPVEEVIKDETVAINPEIKELPERVIEEEKPESKKLSEQIIKEEKPKIEEVKQLVVKEKIEEDEEADNPIASSKKRSEPEFTLDLEALKREFALESETAEKTEPVNEVAPIIIGNMDDEDDEDDADFFPPPPTDSPNSITNMSPDEEEPDDEAEIIQKLPQTRKRKPRNATKMKRDDFERILGKRPEQGSTDEIKEVPEVDQPESTGSPDIKAVEKPIEEAKARKILEEPEQEKAVKSKKKKVEEIQEKVEEVEKNNTVEEVQHKEINKDKSDKVKEVMSQMEKASSISKSQSKRTNKKRPKKDMEENSSPIEIIKSAPKKTPKKSSNVKKEVASDESDEMTGRNSVKSFIELGRSKDSTSISRASVSKKRGRTNKSKPASSDGTTNSGSKDDDESGGASSLIDKFITENPSIQRRDMKDEILDLSQESVKWHPELASEYLAQIYTDQGNKTRAISIYEALSLKFPEKKSYFAGLIKKLKK